MLCVAARHAQMYARGDRKTTPTSLIPPPLSVDFSPTYQSFVTPQNSTMPRPRFCYQRISTKLRIITTHNLVKLEINTVIFCSQLIALPSLVLKTLTSVPRR